MAEVKWIKIATEIFDNRKIRQIESLPDGDAIIVIWLKLLCLAGNINDMGYVYFTKEIPYTDQMLATQFNRPITTIQLALKTFEQFGMIDIIDDILHISNWEKYQNIEGMEKIREQTRKRVAEYRKRQKEQALLEEKEDVTLHVTSRNAIDKNKNKNKNIDNIYIPADSIKKDKNKPVKDKYGEYQNVLLTKNEYENIANAYGLVIRDKAIKFLDEYIEEKGYKSKSHNLAIRRWVIKAVNDQEAKNNKHTREEVVPEWIKKKKPGFNDFQQNDYDFEELEKQVVANDPDFEERKEKLQNRLKEKYAKN